jgi:hypothetical protein
MDDAPRGALLMPTIKVPKRVMAVAATLVAISIVVVSLLGSGLLDDGQGVEELVARFSVNRTLLRLGETVTCASDGCRGDIEGYHWDFGDGNVSSWRTGSHLYEFGGCYNITLTVFDGRGRSANCTVLVGVQPTDYTHVREFGKIQWWFGDGRMGTSIEGPIGPNMGRPTVQIHLEIDNAMGDMTLEVWLAVGRHRSETYTHSISTAREDIDLVVDILPENLYESSEHHPSFIEVQLMIEKGQVDGGLITLDVVFPFEDQGPPIE